MSLCGSTHWEVAAWLVENVDEDILAQVLSVRDVSDGGREARTRFIHKIHTEYRDDVQLAAILRAVGGDPQTQQSVMREALKHVVGYAYSKYSSVYPGEWFAELLRDTGRNDGDMTQPEERVA